MPTELPQDLIARFLRSILNQFYKGRERLFYQEKKMLKMAITWPARWLDERGQRLPPERYQAILTHIFQTVNRRGNLAKIDSLGRYLLHCVQEDMKHHGEEYYDQAKQIAVTTTDVLDRARQGIAPYDQAADSFTANLAQVHRALSADPTRKRRQAPASPELFPGKPHTPPR